MVDFSKFERRSHSLRMAPKGFPSRSRRVYGFSASPSVHYSTFGLNKSPYKIESKSIRSLLYGDPFSI